MNNRLRLLLVFFIISLIFGCMRQPITESTMSNIASRVVKETDPFSSIDTFVGIDVGGYEYMVGSTHYTIRSFKGSSKITHQVYIYIDYSNDWQFFERANLLGGTPLNMVKINQKVKYCKSYGCEFEEIVGINFTHQELKNFESSGLAIKLYAKSGHTRVINIPPNYIQGQLAAVSGNPSSYKPKPSTWGSNTSSNPKDACTENPNNYSKEMLLIGGCSKAQIDALFGSK